MVYLLFLVVIMLLMTLINLAVSFSIINLILVAGLAVSLILIYSRLYNNNIIFFGNGEEEQFNQTDKTKGGSSCGDGLFDFCATPDGSCDNINGCDVFELDGCDLLTIGDCDPLGSGCQGADLSGCDAGGCDIPDLSGCEGLDLGGCDIPDCGGCDIPDCGGCDGIG